MNDLLERIGWKTYRGNWDKTEVLVDMVFIVVIVIIGGVTIWLKQYT